MPCKTYMKDKSYKPEINTEVPHDENKIRVMYAQSELDRSCIWLLTTHMSFHTSQMIIDTYKFAKAYLKIVKKNNKLYPEWAINTSGHDKIINDKKGIYNDLLKKTRSKQAHRKESRA